MRTDYSAHFVSILLFVFGFDKNPITQSTRTAPTMHPNPLWIMSSHSNNPRIVISWLVSIVADISTPNTSASCHFIFRFIISGSNAPAGKSNIQFSRFSFSNCISWYRIMALHDQNGINSYCRTEPVLVNTVEPNTIPRKTSSVRIAAAWSLFIFSLHIK